MESFRIFKNKFAGTVVVIVVLYALILVSIVTEAFELSSKKKELESDLIEKEKDVSKLNEKLDEKNNRIEEQQKSIHNLEIELGQKDEMIKEKEIMNYRLNEENKKLKGEVETAKKK